MPRQTSRAVQVSSWRDDSNNMKPLELEGLRTAHLRQTICRVESRSRCSKERTPATGAARSLFPVHRPWNYPFFPVSETLSYKPVPPRSSARPSGLTTRRSSALSGLQKCGGWRKICVALPLPEEPTCHISGQTWSFVLLNMLAPTSICVCSWMSRWTVHCYIELPSAWPMQTCQSKSSQPGSGPWSRCLSPMPACGRRCATTLMWRNIHVHVNQSNVSGYTRAPASWHTLATARSRGRAPDASTPEVAQYGRLVGQSIHGWRTCAERPAAVGCAYVAWSDRSFCAGA